MKTVLAVAIMVVVVLASMTPLSAGQAAFRTLYRFPSNSTNQSPVGLVRANDILYGAFYQGGTPDDGFIFALEPPAVQGGKWSETVIHNFDFQAGDGGLPFFPPIAGAGGVLYGVTPYGGGMQDVCIGGPPGCGMVYELSPPTEPGGSWTETVLYSFALGGTGRGPEAPPLFCSDAAICTAGALYGTAGIGGAYNHGVVFQLQPPSSSGGAWTESVLYSFSGGDDGSQPVGMVMSRAGVLYGVTEIGGSAGAGTVFELDPPTTPGETWTEKIIYSFQGFRDGSLPYQPPVIGPDGSLYGSTQGCGSSCADIPGDALIFRLEPPSSAGATWTKKTLHNFGNNVSAPSAPLVFRDGALYGSLAVVQGTPGNSGRIFKLQHVKGDKWIYTTVYTFRNNVNSDGNFAMDKDGTIFGITNHLVDPQSGQRTYTVYRLKP